MIIRPYGSEKFDKPGFETFYGAIKVDGFVKRPISANNADIAFLLCRQL